MSGVKKSRFVAALWVSLHVISLAGHVTVSAANYHKMSPHRQVDGRIEELDNYLLQHGDKINHGKDLDTVRNGLKKIADSIHYNPEYEDYYVQVVDLIANNGGDSRILNKERERLNAMLSSSSYGLDGGVERQHSIVRKNILEAFIDAIAEYILNDPIGAFNNMGGSGGAFGNQGAPGGAFGNQGASGGAFGNQGAPGGAFGANFEAPPKTRSRSTKGTNIKTKVPNRRKEEI